jgi:hypothetical protein
LINVRHFREKLCEEHGIKLSYTWVKQALQGAGLEILSKSNRNQQGNGENSVAKIQFK